MDRRTLVIRYRYTDGIIYFTVTLPVAYSTEALAHRWVWLNGSIDASINGGRAKCVYRLVWLNVWRLSISFHLHNSTSLIVYIFRC